MQVPVVEDIAMVGVRRILEAVVVDLDLYEVLLVLDSAVGQVYVVLPNAFWRLVEAVRRLLRECRLCSLFSLSGRTGS
jgi:hypothetical protein